MIYGRASFKIITKCRILQGIYGRGDKITLYVEMVHGTSEHNINLFIVVVVYSAFSFALPP